MVKNLSLLKRSCVPVLSVPLEETLCSCSSYHLQSRSKAACTHTGFLPESDRALVVGVFTRTGITAAGGGRYLNQSPGTDRFR